MGLLEGLASVLTVQDGRIVLVALEGFENVLRVSGAHITFQWV